MMGSGVRVPSPAPFFSEIPGYAEAAGPDGDGGLLVGPIAAWDTSIPRFPPPRGEGKGGGQPGADQRFGPFGGTNRFDVSRASALGFSTLGLSKGFLPPAAWLLNSPGFPAPSRFTKGRASSPLGA